VLRAFASGRLFGERFGGGPPRVLALHGWGRDHHDFGRTLDGLDAIALDLPGFGASPAPPEAWGAAEYGEALLPVLDEFEVPAVVLGHSFGGRVAVCLAAGRPERIGGLVLTGAPLIRRASLRKPAIGFRAKRFLHRMGLLSDARMESARHRYGSADYRAASGVMREVLVKAVGESYEKLLPKIVCPVELVWGADDAEVPLALAKAAAELLPRVKLTICPGVGHFIPSTAPDALRAAILRLEPEAGEQR
jgi:pimeloyl-ACP methyl ester carboxylesterase